MTAQQAINKIKAEKTTFLGHVVSANNYAIEIRQRLQEMAENGEICPIEYKKALEITWPEMSDAEKNSEYAD